MAGRWTGRGMAAGCALAAIAGVGFIAPARADDLENGQALFDTQAYSLAAPKFESYLAANPQGPNVPRAEFMLGECYYHLKNWDRAASALKKFVASDRTADTKDERPFGEAHLGDADYQLKDYQAAAAAYRLAVQDAHDKAVPPYATFWLAESLFQAKDYPAALKGYAALLEKFPDDKHAPVALLAKGICQEQVGQNADAAVTFRSYLQKYSKEDGAAEAAIRLGDALNAAKDYPAAAAAYERVIQDYPTTNYAKTDAPIALAAARFNAKDYKNAAPAYERIAAQQAGTPDGLKAEFQAAFCYYKLGEMPQAQAAWKKVAASGEGQLAADSQYLLGTTQLDAKQWAGAYQALQVFATRYRDDKRVGYAYVGMGDAASAEKNYEQAAAAYARAEPLVTDPKVRQPVLENLLWAYDKLGRTEESKRIRAQLMHEFPGSKIGSASALADADQLYTDKQWPQALAAYQAFAREHPNSPDGIEASYWAAQCMQQMGQLDPAAAALRTLNANHPTLKYLPSGLLSAANAYFKKGDFSQAIALYTLIINGHANSPEEAMALYGRGSANFNSQKLDAAYIDYAQLVKEHKADRNAAEAAYSLGIIREQQNRPLEAVAAYQKSLADYEQSKYVPEEWFRVGNLQAGLKHNEEAEKAWEMAAATDTKGDYGQQALSAEGNLLLLDKKNAAAEKVFAHLKAKYPNAKPSDAAILHLAEDSIQHNKWDEARTQLESFLTDYSASQLLNRARYDLAVVDYNKGSFAAAGATFKKAADGDAKEPFHSEATYWASRSMLKAQDYSGALPLAQSYIANAPAPITGGDPKAAADARARKAEMALAAGRCEQETHHPAEAIPLLEQAKKLDSDDFGPEADTHIGECYLAQQKPIDAAATLVIAAGEAGDDDHPLIDEISYNAGQAFTAAHDKDNAIKWYKKAAESTKGGTWSTQAKQKLDALK